MAREGCWLTGRIGTARVVELAATLNRRTAEQVRAAGAAAASYRPWMSCRPRIEYFTTQRPCDFDLLPTPAIIHQTAHLDYLDQAFAVGPEDGFAQVGMAGSPLRVAPPNSPGLSAWHREITEAQQLLATADPSFALRIQGLVQEFIPLALAGTRSLRDAAGRGLSHHHYRGGVFLGPAAPSPFPILELAISLIHEVGHQAAMVYQYADTILTTDYAQPVYSAVRKTNRPAILSFHALVALVYMIEFTGAVYGRLSDKTERDYSANRWRELRADGEVGWQALQGAQFTELGRGLMDEFQRLLANNLAA